MPGRMSPTVDPGTATGNFYEIVPEAGESTGDWVTVTVDYAAMLGSYSEGDSSTSTIVNGGFGRRRSADHAELFRFR